MIGGGFSGCERIYKLLVHDPTQWRLIPTFAEFAHVRRVFDLTLIKLVRTWNRPGMSGDSTPWEGWSHVSEFVEEVPARAA